MDFDFADIKTDLARRIRPLTADEMQALEDSVARDGILVPVLVNSRGVLIDGYHRLQLAQKLDIDCPFEVLEEDDEPTLVRMAHELNACRRQMTRAERDAAIVEARMAGHKVAEIAAELGVGVATVKRTLADAGLSRTNERRSAAGAECKKTHKVSNDTFSDASHAEWPATPQLECKETHKVQNCTFTAEGSAECKKTHKVSNDTFSDASHAEWPAEASIPAETAPIVFSAPPLPPPPPAERLNPSRPERMVVYGALINLAERGPVSPDQFVKELTPNEISGEKMVRRIDVALDYLTRLKAAFEFVRG